jgi:predicted phage-related endonuclease
MKDLLVQYANNELQVEEINNKISEVIADLKLKQENLENINKEIKEKILATMEENGEKKFENEFISITYVAPTTRTTVDSKKLKDEQPQIFEQYSKVSNVKSSVRIKVKNKPNEIENKEVKELDL